MYIVTSLQLIPVLKELIRFCICEYLVDSYIAFEYTLYARRVSAVNDLDLLVHHL